MSIRINFDTSNNPEVPTLVLATKSGVKLGELIHIDGVTVNDSLTNPCELSFTAYKNTDGEQDRLWDDITPMRLLWCREWDKWFVIDVETEESDMTAKHVTAKSLSESELSQVYLYGVEVNTENDISREDYEPTILYNASNPKASLLHRILERTPHYSIAHVDTNIARIQRTFAFDGISVYDALNEIAEEIECLVVLDSNSKEGGGINRTIKLYDLNSTCMNNSCSHLDRHNIRYRGQFDKTCPICGSTNIVRGYGEDTNIFVSNENLTNDVVMTPDTDSVKNCFRLEAGDDLMTAAVISCNPNGSQYIWRITDDMMTDMSSGLQNGIRAYNTLYDECKNTKAITLNTTAYNSLVTKYRKSADDYSTISSTVRGFSNLTLAYFDTVDFLYYVKDSMSPAITDIEVTATQQANSIYSLSYDKLSLQKITSGTSAATVENALSLLIKSLPYSTRFTYKITTTAWQNGFANSDAENNDCYWRGTVTVINNSNEDDIVTTPAFGIVVDDDYETYVKNIVKKRMATDTTVGDNISTLFDKTDAQFRTALSSYSLSNLDLLYNCCQGVIDILMDAGYGDKGAELYESFYLKYYNKLQIISEEVDSRAAEIDIIEALQDEIVDSRQAIMDMLDFEANLGPVLWSELSSYRREDVYQNSNYISDGLSNSALLTNAMEFIEGAESQLEKAANIQYSISTTLQNLLVIPAFRRIVDSFEVGNWIHVEIDDSVYKLRLVSYQIEYDDLDTIHVEFSDVTRTASGASDMASLIGNLQSISTSFDSVTHQVDANKKYQQILSGWVNDGLDITNRQIVNDNDDQRQTWDDHGLLIQRYDPVTDDFYDTQMKIVNRGMYITDDKWKSVKTAVGHFMYFNPKTQSMESGYGVIADTLVGNLILSEEVGVYNQNGSIELGNNGMTITASGTGNNNGATFTIQRADIGNDGGVVYSNLMSVDSRGNLVLNGTMSVFSTSDGNHSFEELLDTDPDRYLDQMKGLIVKERDEVTSKSISSAINTAKDYAYNQLNDYKAEIGQYMKFDDKGLTIGAMMKEDGVNVESAFKTVIDNRRMAFMQGTETAAYISNQQLYISSAVIGHIAFTPLGTDGADGLAITWTDI